MSQLVETEIGSYPSSWRVDRFDSLFAVQQGRQVSKANSQGDNQKPFLRTKNVFWGKLDLEDLDEMHFSASDEARLTLKQGDLLICEGGSIGRTAVWKGQLATCYYQNHLHRARLKNDDADSSYVLYWLWYAFEVGSVYFGRGNVTTIPNLSQSKLCELPLAIPPLPEQRKIAAVLGVVQRAMEQQERLLATTAELKKTLLHQLFTQGLRDEAQKETDIGPVPESWEVVPLSDCAVVQTGVAKGRKFDGKETIDVPYLRVANVQSGYLDLSEMKNITILAKESVRYALHDGDIVLTEGGDFDKLGRGFIWKGQIKDCVHQNHVFAVRVNRNRLLPEFFAHQSQSQYGKAYFLSVAHKTTNLACINTTKLKAFPVLIPSLEEQRRIVAALEGVDAKLSTVRRKHATLAALFRTLLHQLMTGQVRVEGLALESTLGIP